MRQMRRVTVTGSDDTETQERHHVGGDDSTVGALHKPLQDPPTRLRTDDRVT